MYKAKVGQKECDMSETVFNDTHCLVCSLHMTDMAPRVAGMKDMQDRWADWKRSCCWVELGSCMVLVLVIVVEG